MPVPGGNDKEHCHDVEQQPTPLKRYMQDAKHDKVAQYTDQAEDKRIRQQLARNGNRDVAARRLQPLTGCTELYFASYGIYRDKQYQHLKEYKKERLAQVDRVIQRRVINGMIVGLHGE